MLKRIISKVKEQLNKITGTKSVTKKTTGNNTSWEKRKSELMEKARRGDLPGQSENRNRRPSTKKRSDSQSSEERPQKRRPQGKNPRWSKPNDDKPWHRKPVEDKTRREKPDDEKPLRAKTGTDKPSHVKNSSSGEIEKKPFNKRRRPPRRKPDVDNQQQPEIDRVDEKIEEETVFWDISQFVVEPEEGKKRFHDLKIPTEIMHAISDLNFKYCTPIQAEILEKTLGGKDATGKAQTGTGKTAAFLITAIAHLINNKPVERMQPGVPRVLIIAPTRELVIQIERDSRLLSKYTKLYTLAVFGGMDYRKQKAKLSRGKVDILVATPGRLLDFKSKGDIKLNKVEILVIDEADRMLDMGFIPDVKKIVRSTPPKEERQTLLLSATLNENVGRLAASWTKDSFDVEIDPDQIAVETVEQKVFIVSSSDKYKLLQTILEKEDLQRVIIFANRRDETKLLEANLSRAGISCRLLSGDVDQRQRLRTLDEFKEGKIRVLVATDVASRGLHIDGVSHVINYTLPEDAEDYVHRIGRTGRAGNSGISISFASEDDSFQIPAIEKFIGRKLICIYPEDELATSWHVEKKETKPAVVEPGTAEKSVAEETLVREKQEEVSSQLIGDNSENKAEDKKLETELRNEPNEVAVSTVNTVDDEIK
ncbi:MAG: ATP-dependent RNA helicase RhlB [Ignavibacteriaceae bacterium]|nr:ATP-dependent RNA helicase RhlB [Ignavibacteriaceae bacterium]